MVPIVGGTFEGHGGVAIRGRILPGGGDTQLIHEDGLTEADARYTLETEAGILIDVRNRGLRHAKPDVMRKLPPRPRISRSWRDRFLWAPASGIRARSCCASSASARTGDRWTDDC